MSETNAPLAPIAHGPDEGEAYWFFGGLTIIKSSGETTGGRVAVTENRMARGGGSPLHIHHREDEWFYVLEGELTFAVGGEVVVAPAGSFVYGPRDVAHTFMVTSEEAHFLLVVEPAGFEEFIRALGQPAPSLEIPPPATEPPDIEAVAKVAAGFGLEIVGPPGIPG